MQDEKRHKGFFHDPIDQHSADGGAQVFNDGERMDDVAQ
jgi:hypothetical protein